MKNRLKAILLATGLTVSMLTTCAYAEATTEAATEVVTEAATEASTEAAGEEQAASEAASELKEEESEAGAAAETGAYAAYYDSMKNSVVSSLQTLSDMDEATIQSYIENSTDTSLVAMIATWDSVREELGNFVEVTSQTVSEEGNIITVESIAKYDKIDENTPVKVTYEYNARTQTASLKWDVQYSMGKLLGQAGMNTLMGVGIVFLVLLFLCFLISQMHWIPDLLNKKENEKKAAEAAAPAPAVAAPAPVEEPEEDLTDDLELVAVITAAIAASENTSTDGFVVRSIKKANRRNWLNA